MRNLAFAILLALAATTAEADIVGPAIIQDDGSLKIRWWTIRLHSIHIPQSNRVCRTTIRPARCGSEAMLALDFRIQGFVRCKPVTRNRDGSVTRNRDGSVSAVCYVRGRGSVLEPDEDLAAYLLRQGLAVAGPEAPFEYVTLERIARAQRRGIWSDALRRVR